MKIRKTIGLAVVMVALTGVAALAAPARDPAPLLKGRVVQWTDATMSLEKRLDAAGDDFRRSNKGDLYFINVSKDCG